MTIKILPYRRGSRSARALADALGCKILKLEGSRWRPRRQSTLINWGNTNYRPEDFPRLRTAPVEMLNTPAVIRNASNKLSFFNMCQREGVEQYVPEFWVSRDEIPANLFDTSSVVCRTVLAGHSGNGIVMATTPDELVPAPLYTKYIKKSQEYRIHLGWRGDEIVTISQQRKARDRNVPDEEVNWQVRNHSNGFIFVRGDVDPPQCVLDACRAVFQVTGLDFGAVDVIYNERSDRAYVLEINTAPGLEGSTVDDYVNFFRSVI